MLSAKIIFYFLKMISSYVFALNSGERTCPTERRQPVGRVPCRFCRGVSEQKIKNVLVGIGFLASSAARKFNQASRRDKLFQPNW
jgi:hypothetical protein